MSNLKLLLVNPNEELCDQWQIAFKGLPNVEIIRASFQAIDTYDCMVSPANSFGIMDGGIDAVITEYFGEELMRRVQAQIIRDHLGEQPIGTCIIVETGHAQHPYLAHTPTMRVPMTVSDTDNAYIAMWAMLTAIHRHNQVSERPIASVVCPGFGTGIGAIPYDKAAQHMAIAYKRFLSSPTGINWAYADERHFEVVEANRQQLIGLLHQVQARPDAMLADQSVASLISFLNGVKFALSNFDLSPAQERRVVQAHGWTWNPKRHYAYEMQDRGHAIEAIIAEVIGIQIEALGQHHH